MPRLKRDNAVFILPVSLRQRWSGMGEGRRRVMLLIGIFAGGLFGYVLAISALALTGETRERELGSTWDKAEMALYLQPMSIDAANSSMQVKVSVVPLRRPDGTAPLNVGTHESVLLMRRGTQTEQIRIRANQALPETTFEIDLNDGSIRDYPLDRYTSTLKFRSLRSEQEASGPGSPIHITLWEGVFGFEVHGQEASTTGDGEFSIMFKVRRTGATRFFGIAVYGAMVVLSICAATIGTLVFVGIRRIEVTLIGALGAVIFALPALRNALPGSPPLGVRADIFVYFWAELTAIIALALFVVAWSRRGARPERHT